MVALATPAPPLAVPPSAVAGRGPLVRFTVDDVQAMLRAGLLPEDATTELLDGCLVRKDRSALGADPMSHSPGHRYSVTQLTNLAGTINSPERHIQIQLPIVCGDDQMPEPDFAVICGPATPYVDHLPAAANVLCIIEVADSSLERDRDEKLPVYARAGVPQYVILNLRNRTAEVHADPDRLAGTYATRVVVPATAAIVLVLTDAQRVGLPLTDVLPP